MSAVKQIKQYKSGRFYRDSFRGKLSWNGNERNVLLRNETGPDGQLRFVNVAMAQEAASIRDGRGMAVADFDNDGDLDIVVQNHPGDQRDRTISPTLLRNDIGSTRNWVAFELAGTESNRDGVGALVTMRYRCGNNVCTATRHVSAGSGYASQNGKRISIGLGESSEILELAVRWPGGKRQRFKDVPIRKILRITEGHPAVGVEHVAPRSGKTHSKTASDP